MINFKLDEVLKQYNCSRTKFANLAGVRPNTINDMCNGNTKRIEVETLNSILVALNKLSDHPILIEDVVEYREEHVENDWRTINRKFIGSS